MAKILEKIKNLFRCKSKKKPEQTLCGEKSQSSQKEVKTEEKPGEQK